MARAVVSQDAGDAAVGVEEDTAENGTGCLLAIGAMGLCFNPLGRVANSNALRFAPMSEVALFTPIETVAGTVWAALFLSELPRPAAVVGAAVVVAGVLYGTVGSTTARLPRTRA